ncbi:hypothetical protein F4778DRAFT_779166 [Xylariomycetidae sp. FL2044]|nr:hypothetical protein F4778DRAFT_779166 [Xylariomycetidae sp. FL2044]
MTSHTGIFTSPISVASVGVTTTDVNGFVSTTVTQSVVANIFSWLPDGNYTYLTYTYLPFHTESTQSPETTAQTSTIGSTPSQTPSTTSKTLGGGAIAGIVIGTVAGVAIFAALGWLVLHYRRKARGNLQRNIKGQGVLVEGLGESSSPWDQQPAEEQGDRYELGQLDSPPRSQQQQYQKPELQGSTADPRAG